MLSDARNPRLHCCAASGGVQGPPAPRDAGTDTASDAALGRWIRGVVAAEPLRVSALVGEVLVDVWASTKGGICTLTPRRSHEGTAALSAFANPSSMACGGQEVAETVGTTRGPCVVAARPGRDPGRPTRPDRSS